MIKLIQSSTNQVSTQLWVKFDMVDKFGYGAETICSKSLVHASDNHDHEHSH